MNTKTPYVRETMAQARSLQSRYNRLGASGTQNVRNPIPMKDLVLTVLPTIPAPDANITVTRTVTAIIKGKTYRKRVKSTAVAGEVLPVEMWEKTPTAEEVTAALQAKGFFANLGTVRASLNAAHYRSGVASMRFVRPTGNPAQPNTSYCRYFIPATE